MPELLGVRADGLRQFARDVKAADAALLPRFRRALKEAADVVADQVRANAAWSRRIPGSVKTGATQRGAYVKAGGDGAPHAAIYEKGGRHPVFGNPNNWVDVSARPFMVAALEAKADAAADKAAEALDAYARDAGFK